MKILMLISLLILGSLTLVSCQVAGKTTQPEPASNSASGSVQKTESASAGMEMTSTQDKSSQEKAGDQRKEKSMSSEQNLELATLGGGCFWCVEAVFNDLRGVEKVVSGYSGGKVDKPTYEQVSAGDTGHAEVIQIAFNPKDISFGELLEVFFTVHDPTTLNRQGADVGTQYRSAIFYHSPEQKAVAEKVIAEVNEKKIWDNPIVTEVTAFSKFYVAESYHQLYYARNPNAGYCRVVIAPKVNKFRKQFVSKLKKQVAQP
jgi:peptide-methionine (S)-S-oxide reductase